MARLIGIKYTHNNEITLQYESTRNGIDQVNEQLARYLYAVATCDEKTQKQAKDWILSYYIPLTYFKARKSVFRLLQNYTTADLLSEVTIAILNLFKSYVDYIDRNYGLANIKSLDDAREAVKQNDTFNAYILNFAPRIAVRSILKHEFDELPSSISYALNYLNTVLAILLNLHPYRKSDQLADFYDMIPIAREMYRELYDRVIANLKRKVSWTSRAIKPKVRDFLIDWLARNYEIDRIDPNEYELRLSELVEAVSATLIASEIRTFDKFEKELLREMYRFNMLKHSKISGVYDRSERYIYNDTINQYDDSLADKLTIYDFRDELHDLVLPPIANTDPETIAELNSQKRLVRKIVKECSQIIAGKRTKITADQIEQLVWLRLEGWRYTDAIKRIQAKITVSLARELYERVITCARRKLAKEMRE